MIITDNIRQYCEANDTTITQFAKRCGIATGLFGKWERGEIVPSIATIIKMQDATGIPAGKWLEENGLD